MNLVMSHTQIHTHAHMHTHTLPLSLTISFLTWQNIFDCSVHTINMIKYKFSDHCAVSWMKMSAVLLLEWNTSFSPGSLVRWANRRSSICWKSETRPHTATNRAQPTQNNPRTHTTKPNNSPVSLLPPHTHPGPLHTHSCHLRNANHINSELVHWWDSLTNEQTDMTSTLR